MPRSDVSRAQSIRPSPRPSGITSRLQTTSGCCRLARLIETSISRTPAHSRPHWMLRSRRSAEPVPQVELPLPKPSDKLSRRRPTPRPLPKPNARPPALRHRRRSPRPERQPLLWRLLSVVSNRRSSCLRKRHDRQRWKRVGSLRQRRRLALAALLPDRSPQIAQSPSWRMPRNVRAKQQPVRHNAHGTWLLVPLRHRPSARRRHSRHRRLVSVRSPSSIRIEPFSLPELRHPRKVVLLSRRPTKFVRLSRPNVKQSVPLPQRRRPQPKQRGRQIVRQQLLRVKLRRLLVSRLVRKLRRPRQPTSCARASIRSLLRSSATTR